MLGLKTVRNLALAGAAILAAATPALADDAKSLPEWKDYMATLSAAGDGAAAETYQGDDPANRQDAWNLMFAQIARGYLSQVYADADYPEFAPLYNAGFNVAAPNPDYMYYGTPLDGHGTYRLRGIMGTNRFTFIQFSGRKPDGEGTANMASMVLGSFTLSDMKANPDGTFEVLLSAERPAGYTGNWQRLDPGVTSVFMRAVSYDWAKERDPVVGIERTDKPAQRGRQSAEDISKRLSDLAAFVKNDSRFWWKHMADLQKRDLWNKIGVEPWGTFPGQVYLEGLYKLADDEALILETDVPKTCRYWGFLVGDMQFRTIDWVNHQSSLNGFQAKLDSDGKFRAVIAKTDPGVPNWLDTGGYSAGVIQGRWNVCDSSPVPTARLVKLSQLRKYLPKDTAVVTPEQRDTQLRDRRLGAQLRRKW